MALCDLSVQRASPAAVTPVSQTRTLVRDHPLSPTDPPSLFSTLFPPHRNSPVTPPQNLLISLDYLGIMTMPLELGSYHREPNVSSLESQLVCPICLELFTKPVVILPCQHNLCRKCANELFQGRGTMVGAGGHFRCPSCQHEVVLDRHGIYGLQRNLLVENIIDVYKQQSSSSGPSLKTAGHPMCEEHEDKKVNIYCLSCHIPTCSLCKVFGAHKACQVAPMPEVYEQQKAELSGGIGTLVAANDHVQAFITELEDTCKNIEENCESQKQMVCEKFDRMSSILEERRNAMLRKITTEQEEKAGHARSLTQTYKEHLEANSKLVETALHTIEEPDMATFLQSSRSLIEKVTEAAKVCTVETLEPGFENMDHYKVDFDEEERSLHLLDFIKPEDEVQEVPDELESQPKIRPEADLGPDLVLESEPIIQLKDVNPRAKIGEAEEIGVLGEACTGPTKELPNDHKSLNTHQDELGGGDSRTRASLAEAREDWYKSSGWRPGNPSSPVWSEAWESADPPSLVASEPQLPSTSAGASAPPTCPVDPDGQLAQSSPDPTQGLLALFDSEEDSEQGEISAGQGQSTSLSVQAISLIFYILALVIILQRVWGYIRCITCP
ncbi:tripartite motif containing 101 isoform X3 [Paramormyrops kingsleyae]|uniref:tripartite motif containing 101 isoform X3 n=1 Tax=Paramormyrops kingsleyae TaxID=1676925 RepID=UPI003B97C188